MPSSLRGIFLGINPKGLSLTSKPQTWKSVMKHSPGPDQ